MPQKKPMSARRTLKKQQEDAEQEGPTEPIMPGNFSNGRLYGETQVNYKNGDKFRGSYKDGRANAHGVMKYN